MTIKRKIEGVRANGKIFLHSATIEAHVTLEENRKILSLSHRTGPAPVTLSIPLEPLLPVLRKAMEKEALSGLEKKEGFCGLPGTN